MKKQKQRKPWYQGGAFWLSFIIFAICYSSIYLFDISAGPLHDMLMFLSGVSIGVFISYVCIHHDIFF